MIALDKQRRSGAPIRELPPLEAYLLVGDGAGAQNTWSAQRLRGGPCPGKRIRNKWQSGNKCSSFAARQVWVTLRRFGHVRATVGDPQAAEVIEKIRRQCPQLSPECGDGTFPTFGPQAD